MSYPLTPLPHTDPFAEADEDTGEQRQSQGNYIHIRIQRESCSRVESLCAPCNVVATERNGRKTLTTVQGLPKKFDQKKILRVIKKEFACNGTIVNDSEMGEVIQLQGDQRKNVQEFLTDEKEGLGLDTKTIKVCTVIIISAIFFFFFFSNSQFTRFTVSKPATLCPRQRASLGQGTGR